MPSRSAWSAGVMADVICDSSSAAQVLGRPLEHQARGVTLDERQAGERPVALRRVDLGDLLQIPVLVLERVVVLVSHEQRAPRDRSRRRA